MAIFPDSFIRSNMVLNRKQVEQIDELLRSRWKLFSPGSSDNRANAVFEKIPPEAHARLEAHTIKRFMGTVSEEDDLAFYDEIAQPPFGSWVSSSRRSYILDTIVAADTYITIFQPKHVVDIGTGIGFGAEILARRHPSINFTGIDRSSGSIKAAKDKSVGLKNLNYMQADLLKEPNLGTYDLAISLAGIPCGTTKLTAALVDKTATMLKPNGVLLGYSTNCLAQERQGAAQALGLVHKSVVGGFVLWGEQGATWNHAPFELFQIGATDRPEAIDYDPYAQDWPVFANYVNGCNLDYDRHTFAYHRTN
jgi:2-polyprenyl-3-methyl-5-hydroxy-6-metoxy-1,4-benzoquinol methylase